MKKFNILTGILLVFLILSGMTYNRSLPISSQASDSIPTVLPENHSDLITTSLKAEAALKFASHVLPSTPAGWNSYSEKLRNEIIRKTGVVVNHSLPVNMKETVTIERPGYKIKNIYYQARPGIYATGNLYIPDGSGPFPGVIVMCGHSINGRLYDNYQSVGHTLALNGYVALAIDPWGAGERTTVHGQFEYHGASLGASLMNIGESLMGAQISDNMRGVDLLCSLPYIDKNRIGATGASGGGNQTMWVAAVDERIRAAVPVVSVGTFESYVMNSNCVCELLIDGLTFTEEAGVLALANAIMPCNHHKDSNAAFFPAELMRSYNNAKPVFAMKSSTNNITFRLFDITHGYHPEDRAAMLGWFDLMLKGKGDGSPKKEIPFELVPAEKLMTFEAGKRDVSVINTEEYCKKIGKELRSALLSGKSVDIGRKRSELGDVLRISDQDRIRRINRFPEINRWQRVSIETTDGKLIPVVYSLPAGKNSEWIILTDPSGKNSIPLAYIDEMKKTGKGIIIPDLTGTGEASSTKEAKSGNTNVLHTLARSELWLGKTILGEWVSELNVITDFLRTELKASRITVNGRKEAGLAGLFLAATKGNVDEIILRQSPVSYLFDKSSNIDFFSMAVHVPGFLNWGDVSLAAALSGKPVTFIQAVTMSGSPVEGANLTAVKNEFDKIGSLCKTTARTTFK